MSSGRGPAQTGGGSGFRSEFRRARCDRGYQGPGQCFSQAFRKQPRRQPAEIWRAVRLIARLKEYRTDHFYEDRDAATLAMGAIIYLEREDAPGMNSFLLALCWRSLDPAFKAISACQA